MSLCLLNTVPITSVPSTAPPSFIINPTPRPKIAPPAIVANIGVLVNGFIL